MVRYIIKLLDRNDKGYSAKIDKNPNTHQLSAKVAPAPYRGRSHTPNSAGG